MKKADIYKLNLQKKEHQPTSNINKNIQSNPSNKKNPKEKNPLIEPILRFAEGDNGLFMLNPPTGYGKTYAMEQCILNLMKKNQENSDYSCLSVFCTPTKQLRDESYKKIKSKLENGQIAIVLPDKKSCLKNLFQLYDIDSNRKMPNRIISEFMISIDKDIKIMENYFSDNRIETSKQIKEKEINFKNQLENTIIAFNETFNTFELKQEEINNRIIKFNSEFSILEKTLQQYIRRHYVKIINDKKKDTIVFNQQAALDDLKNLYENVRFSNILQTLFPSMFLPIADAVFLTHDKFLYPIFDAIYGKRHLFEQEYYINHAILFVDESVEFVKKLQNQLIDEMKTESALSSVLSSIQSIMDKIVNKEYSNEVLKYFELDSNPSDKSSQESIPNTLLQIKKELELNYVHPFYSIEMIETLKKKNFFFHSAEDHYITLKEKNSENSYQYLIMELDEKENKYLIKLSKEKPQKDTDKMPLNNFIISIQKYNLKFCYLLFYNVLPYYLKTRPELIERYFESESQPFYEALRKGRISYSNLRIDLIDLFSQLKLITDIDEYKTNALCQYFDQYCKRQLLQKGYTINLNAHEEHFIPFNDVYFDLYNIKTISNTGRDHTLYRIQNHQSIEDYVSVLARRSKVIFTSATNRNPASYNLCLSSLEKNVNIFSLNRNEKEKIEKYTKQKNQKNNTPNVKRYVKTLQNLSNNKDIFDVYKRIQYAFQKNKQTVQFKKLKDYDYLFYLKIILNFEHFFENSEWVPVHLFISTRGLKKHFSFDYDIVTTLFECLCNDYHESIEDYMIEENDNKYPFINLKNDDTNQSLNKKWEIVQERHKIGKRSFVFMTYAAGGVGLNPILPISSLDIQKNQITKINSFTFSNQMVDVNSIYLDKPTQFLIQNMQTEYDLFFNLNRIYRCINSTNEINKIEGMHYIQQIINAYENKLDFLSIPYDRLISYKHYVLDSLIQSTGRINRCNKRRKKIFILADWEIQSIFSSNMPIQSWKDTTFSIDFQRLATQIGRIEFDHNGKVIGKESIENQEMTLRMLKRVSSNGGYVLKQLQSRKQYSWEDIEKVESVNKELNENITISSVQQLRLLQNDILYGLYWSINSRFSPNISVKDIWISSKLDNNQNVEYDVITTAIRENLNKENKLNNNQNFFKYQTLVKRIFGEFHKNSDAINILKKNGFQTDLSNHYDLILSPQGLYKVIGNIGETLAEEYFKNILPNPLRKTIHSDTPEGYEHFDFFSEDYNENLIAIEIKNWANDKLSKTETEKIQKKYFSRCQSDKVKKLILCNVIKDEKYNDSDMLVKIENQGTFQVLFIPYIMDQKGKYLNTYKQTILDFLHK